MGDVLKETLDEIVHRIDTNVEEVKKQTIRTNKRVTKLEKWRWKITGAITVITFLLAPIIYKLFRSL